MFGRIAITLILSALLGISGLHVAGILRIPRRTADAAERWSDGHRHRDLRSDLLIIAIGKLPAISSTAPAQRSLARA